MKAYRLITVYRSEEHTSELQSQDGIIFLLRQEEILREHLKVLKLVSMVPELTLKDYGVTIEGSRINI